MKGDPERTKVLTNNHYLDLGCNISENIMYCSICGSPNKKEERVDTENIWDEEESFCFNCWFNSIRR